MRHMLTGFFTIMFLAGCGDDKSCYSGDFSNATNYSIDTDQTTTPKGIHVDTSGMSVDLAMLDALTDTLEVCLRGALHDQSYSIDRSCLKVKIAPDWFHAPCPNEAEIFACNIPNDRCDIASHHAMCMTTPQFDLDRCYCAGTVQDQDTAVVPPDLAAIRHEFTHIIFNVPDPIPANLDVCADAPASCAY